MFHIVYCGDENYFKFIAVSMTSIVRNTSTARSVLDYPSTLSSSFDNDIENEFSAEKVQTAHNLGEKYIFHIITNLLSEQGHEQLKKLEVELDKVFPTEIEIHFLDEKIFTGHIPWHKSYLPYFRLKLAQFIPDDVKKVLYLDGDTLVNCDVRELFALDIKNHIAATVNELFPVHRQLKHRSGETPHTFDGGYYFNSGVILVNMDQWKARNMERETLQFLLDFEGVCPDQDALNVLFKEDVIKLSCAWCLMIHGKHPPEESLTMDESPHYTIQHTRDDLSRAVANPKIIHYGRKPWLSNGFYVTANGNPYYIPHYELWWDMVAQTPAYKGDLESIKESKKYKDMLKKNKQLEQGLDNNSITVLLFKLNRTIRPFLRNLEKPFKVIRNRLRARKMKKDI